MPATDNFFNMKRRNEKIAAVTAYDAPTARFVVEAGADILLVGDSVGVNILGYAHEREVTLADMTHHIAAVRRGAPQADIIGDLPFATFETPQQARESALKLITAGANCIKFEGPRVDIVEALLQERLDVCCHLGLESQHHQIKRRQGKDAIAACQIFDDALRLDAAGQKFLVLELIPQELAQRITRDVKAVTIGIGSGAATDGQVLVVNDLAGITQRDYKHNRRYGAVATAMHEAVAAYVKDVRTGAFPSSQQAFSLSPEERQLFERMRP
ncbi:MAG: 3-methyl-2-oxobutanoate hydroxymethyltransferase [Methylocystis sp.]